MEDGLRLPEHVRGAHAPATDSASYDGLPGLAGHRENDARPHERSGLVMFQNPLQRPPLPRPQLVTEVVTNPRGRLRAV